MRAVLRVLIYLVMVGSGGCSDNNEYIDFTELTSFIDSSEKISNSTLKPQAVLNEYLIF